MVEKMWGAVGGGGGGGLEHKPARHQGFAPTTEQGHTLPSRAKRSHDAPFAALDMQELSSTVTQSPPSANTARL
jgi:hypothetical protein